MIHSFTKPGVQPESIEMLPVKSDICMTIRTLREEGINVLGVRVNDMTDTVIIVVENDKVFKKKYYGE